MIVKAIRSNAAIAAPMISPQRRCRSGKSRHAIAITMALSPDNKMLMKMIWPTASQKSV